jgi:CHAT domain-containing protein
VRASTGVESTETWFRQRAADADVIHLATHGYFNEYRAASSGPALAMQKLAANPTTSHPSYWAPFVLIGDFRAVRQATTAGNPD